MVKIQEKERAIIEFTCIPEVSIEKAQKLYDIGFKHLREFLLFTMDNEAKKKGMVDIINYKILSQFISVHEEDIPTEKFKCPMCLGMVYAYEEECPECGALFLEEILEVEIEEVYDSLKEMIETVIATPDNAGKFLSELREGEDKEAIMELNLVTEKINEEIGVERGFVVTSISPKDNETNYLIILLPMGEHETQRERVIEDLIGLGAGNQNDYSIEGGNIVNKQADSVKEVISSYISQQNFDLPGMDKVFFLNLKIAKFMESEATLIVEDNRPFLSSLDATNSEHEKIGSIERMLHDTELVKEARKIGDKFILDGISFNNDPISFLLAKESIPVLTVNPKVSIHLLDVVMNIDSIERSAHGELVNLLLKWKSPT
jgi:hypothetical protein